MIGHIGGVPGMTAPQLHKGLRFGPFEVDLHTRELRKHGLRIKLQEKPFRILTLLLERPGESVAREELRRRLWPDEQYGEFDQSLNTAIKKLRHALNDSAATPRFIETQSRFGYRFLGSVQVIAPEPPSPATPIPQSGHPLPRELHNRFLIAIAAVIILSAALLLVPRLATKRSTSAPKITSLAVLPLLNLSPGGEHDYFVDGLTDALITNLARVGALRVISRTSAMHYKDSRELLPQIGRELNVNGIVEGSVERTGQQVRINIKLIDVATERNLLAEVYEGNLENIPVLEDEVAAALIRRIGVPLTPLEAQQLSRSHRLDPEAYESYLKGRFLWNTRTPDGLQKALRYFDEALAKEPTYAPAYAGLADCYNLLSFYNAAKPTESFPKAEAAALKALELDENMAEAHAALGYVRLHFDWDWPGAETEFRRALELNPGDANAHHWYSHYLLAMGRADDAFQAAKRALELDPLNQGVNAHLAHHLIHVEHYDDAIARMKVALELNANSARTHALMGRALEGKRLFESAKAEFQRALRLAGDDRQLEAGLAHVYATEGNLDQARKLLKQLETESSQSFVSPYALASVHVALGEYDLAFKYLSRAYDMRQEELIYLKTDPDLKILRSDPRFNALVRRIRLPL